MANSEFIIELFGLKKAFGNSNVLNGIDLKIKKGTIHALLGQNGAGKTTLLNIISGRQNYNAGRFIFDNSIINDTSLIMPKKIAFLSQHFELFENLTVFENIILSSPTSFDFFYTNRLKLQIKKTWDFFDLNFSLEDRCGDLSAQNRRWLELFMILNTQKDIICLDEPTSNFSLKESEKFWKEILPLVKVGTTVILITHKFKEVVKYCDYVSILQKGFVTETLPRSSVNQDILTKIVFGKDYNKSLGQKISTPAVKLDENVLMIENVTLDNYRSRTIIKDFSLHLHGGEVVGIAGKTDAGQEELSNAILGVLALKKGEIYQRNAARWPVRYVPIDRTGIGAPGLLTVVENITIRNLLRGEFTKYGMIDKKRQKAKAVEIASSIELSGNIDGLTRDLSGGNIQRMIIARETQHLPCFLILNNPNAGLDLNGINFVRNVIVKCKLMGCGIMIFDEDLNFLADVSDRVFILGKDKSYQPAHLNKETLNQLVYE